MARAVHHQAFSFSPAHMLLPIIARAATASSSHARPTIATPCPSPFPSSPPFLFSSPSAITSSTTTTRICVPTKWSSTFTAASAAASASPFTTGGLRTPGARAFFSSGTARLSMSLKSGIVGLPNVGKSTLFNALVENGKAQAANFPFCTIEPNVGVVAVPDTRIEVLAQLSKSLKSVPTSVEIVDIAGLVKGASRGEGLGNKFLSHIRQVDLIVQVVRCFEDNDIVHVTGKVDPAADIDVINLELAFCDIDQIEKRIDRLKKGRVKDTKAQAQEAVEVGALERINKALLSGAPARSVPLNDEERKLVDQLSLLTMKPVIFAANVAESELADPFASPHVRKVREIAEHLNAEVVVVSAQMEAELTELDGEDRTEYLQSLGVEEGGLGALVRATYSLLGLRTYFTSGEKETRAWTIRAGMTAPQAAGVIHTDFERGFIRAETVAYDEFVKAKSIAAARERGLLRQEGKEYVVQEGDVMLFRFNV